VIVDTRAKEIVSGGIYAFRSPIEGSILRECHSEHGGISLRPYNKNYPSTFINWEEFDPASVIGRVSFSVVNVLR
jgi:phage repressor protein C with HTH and peptisase S24 domain